MYSEVEELNRKIAMNAEKIAFIDSVQSSSNSSLITLILPSNYYF